MPCSVKGPPFLNPRKREVRTVSLLDNKIRELIAVGASVAANCHPCVQYHVSKARETGAEEQAIQEALEVGKMVRKGAAGEMDKLLSSLRPAAPCAANTAEVGCGCS